MKGNQNWRKIIKSRDPEFSKASINTSWQTSCSATAYRQYHEKYHFGTEYVLPAIRQRIWVINDRVSVKQIGRGCMICKRRKARPNEPFMSTLPSFRVEQGNPLFFKSGVDFFGPIYVKQKR